METTIASPEAISIAVCLVFFAWPAIILAGWFLGPYILYCATGTWTHDDNLASLIGTSTILFVAGSGYCVVSGYREADPNLSFARRIWAGYWTKSKEAWTAVCIVTSCIAVSVGLGYLDFVIRSRLGQQVDYSDVLSAFLERVIIVWIMSGIVAICLILRRSRQRQALISSYVKWEHS